MLDLSNVTATTIDELREAFNVDSDAFYIRLIDDYLAWFLYLEGGN